MLALKGKHGKRLVAGGAFKGAVFEELSYDQLQRAAKRYPSDVQLQKYAKMVVAAKELEGIADPAPCQPLMLRDSPSALSSDAERLPLRKLVIAYIYKLTLNRVILLVMLIVTLLVLFKPSLAIAVTKVLVRLLRLTLRRMTGFLV